MVLDTGGPRQGQNYGLEVALVELDAMLALGRKPPALEVLGRHADLAAFLSGPVQVLVHGFFGQPADDGGRHQHDQGKENEYANNTFLHVESSV